MNNNIKNKTPRKVFTLKLTESNYKKIREESSKLELTMSGFMSMLIAHYESVDINYNKNDR